MALQRGLSGAPELDEEYNISNKGNSTSMIEDIGKQEETKAKESAGGFVRKLIKKISRKKLKAKDHIGSGETPFLELEKDLRTLEEQQKVYDPFLDWGSSPPGNCPRSDRSSSIGVQTEESRAEGKRESLDGRKKSDNSTVVTDGTSSGWECDLIASYHSTPEQGEGDNPNI